VDAKRYYETFLERFQKMVDTNYHASASLLDFYQGLPVTVDAYIMTNDAVVGLVKFGASENRVEVFSGDFEQIKGELRGRTFDYMVPIYPSHPTSNEEIDASIKYLIENRLREINFAHYLKDVVLGIVNIEGQISEISKTNPWLSKQFGELTQMLSDTRKRAEDVSKMAEDGHERWGYEQHEEMVSFLETYDPATASSQLDTIDLEKVRTFLTEFIRSYRATIDAKSLAKEAFPPLYSDYPYTVDFALLPNKNVAVFFSKATEGMRFVDRQIGFTELEKEFPNKSFNYFLGLPNCIPFDKASAVHHAQVQAQMDLERHDVTMALGEIPKAVEDIENQIIKIKKSNPWLEQNLGELLQHLENTKKPVEKLQVRIDKQKKAGTVLRSYLNTFDPSIAIFPTSGEIPPTTVAPPVYEDVATAQVATPQPSFASLPETPMPPPGEYAVVPPSPTTGEYDLQIPAMGEDPGASSMVGSMEATAMGGEVGDMNEVKSMLYTFERKLADYEKRLHYIDKYTEMIQRQQNKKFKAQKELLMLESRKGRWLGVGIAIGALTIGLLVLLASYDEIIDLISGMF
jgi:hypothetical protein